MEEKDSQEKLTISTISVDLDFEDFPPKNYNPLFFTRVNGALVNQRKTDAIIGIGNRDENGCYNECYCTLEQGDKLGDFFNVLPYGIINKTITGIGATTLELNSKRNSIIVLPTKSIAYSKYKIKEKNNGVDSCMYIGSPIGDIKSDVTIRHIKDYIAKDTGYKKFLVVADSLYKVLEAIGKDNYNDYFLMVDEIDTLQIDNTYRPVLEKVIDFYSKFKQTNRAAVSATLRDFTHPELLKESIITTKYPKLETRDIKLIHTDNEDMCVVNLIKEIQKEDSNANILIAYNSIENISICISLLENELGENISDKIGILCSEKSKDKVDKYYIEIEENGILPRNIVFMTCAYFVGVDINTKCHVVSVSTFKRPFTLLSKEKLTQIVGRCRLGALSETIVYGTKEVEATKSIDEYKDYLLKKARLLVDATNRFKNVLEVSPELFAATNYVEDIIKHVGVEKFYNSSISIIRENEDKELVPSYFNIDALLEKWTLLHELYKDEEVLYDALIKDGHKVDKVTKDYEYTKQQLELCDLNKATKAGIIEQALQKAKINLLELSKENDESQRLLQLKKLQKNSILELKKLYDNYLKLSPYYEAKYLINLLIEHHNDDARLYRRVINSLVFHALDEIHPFKVLVLGTFEYHKIGTDKTKAKITPNIKEEKMKLIFDTYFKGYHVDENNMSALMLAFFKPGTTKKYFKIEGLNPMGLEEPIKKIKDMDASELFNVFILK